MSRITVNPDCNAIQDIDQHRHLFAAWAASRAASVNRCRFRVACGREILEACGFVPHLNAPEQLPTLETMDVTHRKWRDEVISAAETHGLLFTHGVAAKLINIYLKSRFVCGGHDEHERVCALHPPIDDQLLIGLIGSDVGGLASSWRRLRRQRWSRFSSGQYEEVIGLIRQSLDGCPLWQIERYWPGNQ